MSQQTPSTVRSVVLARFPDGVPVPSDFAIAEGTLPEVASGQVLCDIRYLSLDPYLRGVISGRHMGHAIALGDVVPGSAVAQVLQSASTDFLAGDWVVGDLGWRTLHVVACDRIRKLPSDIFPDRSPLRSALGCLGMPGLTAWAGITQLAKVKAGDVVLISAALGPVGSTAGQIAKSLGARVIGIAGGPEKCKLVCEHFGFDVCIDYKNASLSDALHQHCPQGVDVYFDNVGGNVLAAALNKLALHARVVLCGLMDQYNQQQRPPGPNLGPVIAARATLMGLVVYDFYARWDEFYTFMKTMLNAGHLSSLDDIARGIAATPEAFCKLMRGENMGKALVRI